SPSMECCQRDVSEVALFRKQRTGMAIDHKRSSIEMDVRLQVSVLWLTYVATAGITQYACGVEAPAKPTGDRVIAIDVLLEPDAKMAKTAVAANAQLRENYHKCY